MIFITYLSWNKLMSCMKKKQNRNEYERNKRQERNSKNIEYIQNTFRNENKDENKERCVKDNRIQQSLMENGYCKFTPTYKNKHNIGAIIEMFRLEELDLETEVGKLQGGEGQAPSEFRTIRYVQPGPSLQELNFFY
mmetsp:Transcript_8307/g.10798  ORF Transcript_8307/g.10798 Transcript_8307/m.10798 type:complete len:137 (-) Transcript_8307:635-1045(-)